MSRSFDQWLVAQRAVQEAERLLRDRPRDGCELLERAVQLVFARRQADDALAACLKEARESMRRTFRERGLHSR